MVIKNKKKFMKTIIILSLTIIAFGMFINKTYSNVEVTYKEEYIYSGDTLWSIAENEISNNKYFKNKNIREVIKEIKKLNNLTDSKVYNGEIIKIPTYK